MSGYTSDMKAVIVAAGASRRLRPDTDHLPKCFLPVGDRSLVEYSLSAIRSLGIEQIGFVVGYLRDQFPARLGDDYQYIFNPFYATTNNMASLWFAKEFVGDSDFLYMHSDLLYHPDILAMTAASDAEIALAVEEGPCDAEMMKVRVDGLDLLESSKDIPLDEASGEWTGVAKFTASGWRKYLVEVEELLAEGDFNAYDTVAMNRLVARERAIQVVPFHGLPFIEIDTPDDLREARERVLPRLLPSLEPAP